MYKNYRRYKRYSILAKAVIVRGEAGSPGRLTAQINTISQGGMGFYTDVYLEKSTPVFVELLDDVFKGLDVIKGRIASVCSVGNDYFTCIAFDADIPHDSFFDIFF